jgi:hypothetical protein
MENGFYKACKLLIIIFIQINVWIINLPIIFAFFIFYAHYTWSVKYYSISTNSCSKNNVYKKRNTNTFTQIRS